MECTRSLLLLSAGIPTNRVVAVVAVTNVTIRVYKIRIDVIVRRVDTAGIPIDIVAAFEVADDTTLVHTKRSDIVADVRRAKIFISFGVKYTIRRNSKIHGMYNQIHHMELSYTKIRLHRHHMCPES